MVRADIECCNTYLSNSVLRTIIEERIVEPHIILAALTKMMGLAQRA